MTGLKLGLHLSIASGLAATLAQAKRFRLESLQVFSGNPRTWQTRPFDEASAAAFAQGLAEAGISPLVVHAAYLLNLASPKAEIRRRSQKMLLAEMARGRILSAAFLVFHPGSHKESGPEVGCRRVAEAIAAALENGPPGIALAVENTAGGGGNLGGRLEELAEILSLANAGERLLVWLDTAHAFQAGYDLSSLEGVADWLDQAERLFGLERLAGLHINDSKKALGSGVDRHEHLGRGLIGSRGLSAVLAHPRLTGLPGILETPKMSEVTDRANLKAARRLRSLGRKLFLARTH